MATTFSAPLFGEVATALAAYFEGLHNSDATRLAELCADIISLSFGSTAASLTQALCHGCQVARGRAAIRRVS